MTEYDQFLQDYAANSERMHRVGIHSFGFDPGHLVTTERGSVNLPQCLVNKICEVIKVAYPETQDDGAMIAGYQKRMWDGKLKKKKKEK